MSEGQGERGGELVASLLPPLTSTGAVEAVACSASPRLKSTLDVCIIFVAERGYSEWSMLLHPSTSSIVKSRSENKNILNILVDGAPPEFTFAF